ncbi:MAG TPA: methyltransferase [Gaiellaceae bacterium]|nr:methyltransferase [Gaiellaceae bacterium]
MRLAEFAGLELITAPGLVMTPRATSVGLVDRALRHIGGREAVVVDAGTGSGAIAIAIARAAPHARVFATDVNADAVALARRNAERYGVDVTVRHGDLLEPVSGPIDVVVANLPYLPNDEGALHPDLDEEPLTAVFAAGDGLDHYRRLSEASADRLSPDGLLAVQLRGELLSFPAARLDLFDAVLERAA